MRHLPLRLQRHPSLTGKPGKTTVAIVGVDDRNREIPGRFKPEYVGLFRDIMFAIPEFIHNKDKKPIADALANDVALGLTQSGYRATSVPNPASRARNPPSPPPAKALPHASSSCG